MAALTDPHFFAPALEPAPWLRATLDHARHLLPDQGPMGIFVHHNTLHGLQHLPFHEAVAEGASYTGARPYLPEARFRAAVSEGRIERRDLEEALSGSDRPVALGLTERGVRLALLMAPLEIDDVDGLRHRLRTGAFRPDPALWRASEQRLRGWSAPPHAIRPPRRHRDVLMALGGPDPDVRVHAELQRLCAAFLDQGQALWVMPDRAAGFLRAVEHLYRAGGGVPRGGAGLLADLDRLAGRPAEVIVEDSLAALGVDDATRDEFVVATLLALPGWGGMFSRLERRPDEAHHDPHARLVEFLAVRLLLERHLVADACREAVVPLDWRALREMPAGESRTDPLAAAVLLCGLAEAAGASATAVEELDDGALGRLFDAALAFPPVARRRVFQDAYEGRYRRQILDAVAAHRPEALSRLRKGPAKAGFVFCIDEREESLRRAVEEQDPGFETWGVAGFFGVAIDYRGLDDHAPGAHCPAPVTPAHEVHEHPVFPQRARLARREHRRSLWRRLMRRLESGTRHLAGGAFQSLVLGPMSGASMIGNVFAPRAVSTMHARLSAAVLPMPTTRLRSVREPLGALTDRGKHLGFTTAEKVDRVVATLTNLGLVRELPPILVIIGHGSTSLNNPHESAHDCGACGGRRGGANARLFAEMANRPEVRAGVRERGIAIDDHTWFVGALHDTSNDDMTYYDLDRLPSTHTEAFDHVVHTLENARRENARERARRFDDAPLGLSPEQALRHVQGRASSLAQPRPEYGHCTNAVAIVGRRALTRGLFLDRRPFLVSYDPAVDPHSAVLERILAAVGPVGAGINLEYWFSSVDNEVYGCGTKLPHNVTGLLGVMNGHQSDLRTGLPWQMVELHEPMRLLLIVEATPEVLLQIAGRQAEVRELVVNEWIQLVSLDPSSGRMQRFHAGAFVPYSPDERPLPRAARSSDWCASSREFLGPAAIGPAHV